jgi:hypothetical protein
MQMPHRPVALALLCTAFCPFPARGQQAVQHEGLSGTLLDNGRIELVTLDKGGAFVRLTLKEDPKKINPMWDPIRMARETRTPSRFGSSLGHFVCVDGFGPASPDEQKAGLQGHGEAHRLAWERTSAGRSGNRLHAAYRVALPLVQEVFTRRVELVDGEQVVYVDSELESLTAFDRPANWAEHATIGAPFLAPGKTVVDSSAGRCQTRPHQQQPSNRTLASGRDFVYPMAPKLDGSMRDVRLVPDPPDSMDHIGCTVDPSRAHGFVTALNTSQRMLLGYLFRREEYPWIQEWLNYPPTGALSRGLEFGTQPYDVPRRQAVTMGTMFGVPAFRWLPAKGRIGSRFLFFWTRIPDGMNKVDDVRLEGGKLIVTGSGQRIELAASLGL